jgi:mRNA deadenylase 3'-5' endonuclease subunit Ccr4
MDLIEYRIANTFLDRDNVGVVVRLNILDAERCSSHKDRKIVVGNTHLLFNPGRGDIKLGQLAMLLARVHKLAKQDTTSEKHYPIILCGDFNAVPYSTRDVKSLSYTPLYRLIVNGHLSYDGLLRGDIAGQKPGGRPIFKPLLPVQCGVNEMCECFDENAAPNDGSPTEKLPEGCLRHGFKLVSSYGHFTKRGTPEVTTCHGFDTANVDYIFYSSSAEPLNNVDGDLLCKRRYSLPDRDEIKATCGTLPNRTCGSDHLPLVVEFELS